MIWFDKVKNHVGRHKVAYSFGAGVALAGITLYIMRDHRLFRGREITKEVLRQRNHQNTPIMDSIFVGGDNYGTMTNNSVPRRLSYIIQQDGTDNWWQAQAEYARDRGISEKSVSQHILEGKPLPNGESLTRRGIVS
jgi:hypothetical protein